MKVKVIGKVDDERELAPGMIVRLLSGGPLMTLDSTSTDGKLCLCVWFPEIASGIWATKPSRESFVTALIGLAPTS